MSTDGFWGWEIQFSFRMLPPCSLGGPTCMRIWAAQTGLGGILKKKDMKLGRGRRKGWISVGLGEGARIKYDQNTSHVHGEFSKE